MVAQPQSQSPHQDKWAYRLGQVYQAAVAVAGAHDVDTALQMIVDSARQAAGAEFAALGVPGEPGQPMAHFVVSGISPEAAARAGEAPMGRGVLGLLLTGGHSLRLSNLADHPAYRGYPATHPLIRSFLGVPVLSTGEVIGDLYLANKQGVDTFDEDDQRLIELLAAHAAAVIQSLRYQQKEGELRRVRERERLGRQLQDDVLQAMYGSGLLLAHIDLDDKESAAATLREIQASFDLAIDHLRAHLLALSQPPSGEE